MTAWLAVIGIGEEGWSGLSGAARAVAFLWRRDFAPERTDEGG